MLATNLSGCDAALLLFDYAYDLLVTKTEISSFCISKLKGGSYSKLEKF